MIMTEINSMTTEQLVSEAIRLDQEQKNGKIHKCDTKVFVKIPCNTFDFCYNIIVKRQSPQSG